MTQVAEGNICSYSFQLDREYVFVCNANYDTLSFTFTFLFRICYFFLNTPLPFFKCSFPKILDFLISRSIFVDIYGYVKFTDTVTHVYLIPMMCFGGEFQKCAWMVLQQGNHFSPFGSDGIKNSMLSITFMYGVCDSGLSDSWSFFSSFFHEICWMRSFSSLQPVFCFKT